MHARTIVIGMVSQGQQNRLFVRWQIQVPYLAHDLGAHTCSRADSLGLSSIKPANCSLMVFLASLALSWANPRTASSNSPILTVTQSRKNTSRSISRASESALKAAK